MNNEEPGTITPYYIEMENIMERLHELGKMDYPHKRTRYIPGGGAITEDVPEYLEEQTLICLCRLPSTSPHWAAKAT